MTVDVILSRPCPKLGLVVLIGATSSHSFSLSLSLSLSILSKCDDEWLQMMNDCRWWMIADDEWLQMMNDCRWWMIADDEWLMIADWWLLMKLIFSNYINDSSWGGGGVLLKGKRRHGCSPLYNARGGRETFDSQQHLCVLLSCSLMIYSHLNH